MVKHETQDVTLPPIGISDPDQLANYEASQLVGYQFAMKLFTTNIQSRI